MNMRFKYQEGGGLIFADYTAIPIKLQVQLAAQPAQLAKESPKDDNSISIKDILSLLNNIDGLPSDVQKVTTTLMELWKLLSLFSSDGKLSYDKAITLYNQILQLVQYAKFNKSAYIKAAEECLKNNGTYEPIIDLYGRVLVKTLLNPAGSWINVSEYNKNADKYLLVTNADILNLRAENISFAFDNNVLKYVENGIGLDKVTQIIQTALNGIKSNSNKLEGYTGREGNTIINGLTILSEAQTQLAAAVKKGLYAGEDIPSLMSVDGLYKLGYLSESNYTQAKSAEAYLWKALPANARAWLQLKSGAADNQYAGALSLMDSLVNAHIQNKLNIDLDLQNDRDTRGRKVSNDSGKMKITEPMMTVMESGAETTIRINTGTSDELPVPVHQTNLTDKEGKHLGACTVTDAHVSPVPLNWADATLGDQRIVNGDNVAITDGLIYSAWLPTENGLVDFTKLNRLEEVDMKLRQSGLDPRKLDLTDEEAAKINAAYREARLRALLVKDPNGNYVKDTSAYGFFACLKAVAHKDAFDTDACETSKTLLRLLDNQKNEADKALSIINKGKTKGLKTNGDSIWGSNLDLYSGMLFVPMATDLNRAAVASGQLIPEDRYHDLDTEVKLLGKHLEIGQKYNSDGEASDYVDPEFEDIDE